MKDVYITIPKHEYDKLIDKEKSLDTLATLIEKDSSATKFIIRGDHAGMLGQIDYKCTVITGDDALTAIIKSLTKELDRLNELNSQRFNETNRLKNEIDKLRNRKSRLQRMFNF